MVQVFEVQLFAEKKSEVLPFSTDRELSMTDRKSQTQFFCKFLNKPKPTKTFRISLNFSAYKRETLATFWVCWRRLVCYSLWDLRGSVPFNYTRFYWSLNYNQGLVELVAASRSTSEGDLKPFEWSLKVTSKDVLVLL